MSTPILPFAVWASGTNQNSIPANDNSLRNQILNGNVISQAVTAQPASPADGDIYIIAATHTGAQWSGFSPKDLAIYSGGTWYAFAPVEGVVVNVAGSLYAYTSGAWATIGGGGGGGMTNPMTTTGDIIYSSSGSTPARLGVGTNGHVLTLAAGVPTWAAASGGGGGLTNWTDSVNTSTPNATVPVVRLLATNAATNVDAALSPKGIGALTAQVADNAQGGGNKRGDRAVDWQMQRLSADQVASGSNATIGGGYGNKAAGGYSTVAGGSTNTASTVADTVGGGLNNIANGTNSSVIGGLANTSSGQGATSSGENNTASGYAATAMGAQCTAAGNRSSAIGGSATGRGVHGVSARAGGHVNNVGDRQQRELFLRLSNNVNTPKAMTTDGGAAAVTNTANLGLGAVYMCVVEGAITNNTDYVGFSGMCVCDRNGSNVTISGSPTITMVNPTAGASTWSVAFAANTSNQCLEVRVTGPNASHTAFATLRTQELVN